MKAIYLALACVMVGSAGRGEAQELRSDIPGSVSVGLASVAQRLVTDGDQKFVRALD